MIRAIEFIITSLGQILYMILHLLIPNGYGGYITYGQYVMFIFLFGCAIAFIKIFLTKQYKQNQRNKGGKYAKD